MALHCPGWILCIFCANAARETLVHSAPINTIVKNRAKSYYPPRAKKVLNLISRFRSKSNQKSTLGGCIFEKRKNFVHVTKEF